MVLRDQALSHYVFRFVRILVEERFLWEDRFFYVNDLYLFLFRTFLLCIFVSKCK